MRRWSWFKVLVKLFLYALGVYLIFFLMALAVFVESGSARAENGSTLANFYAAMSVIVAIGMIIWTIICLKWVWRKAFRKPKDNL